MFGRDSKQPWADDSDGDSDDLETNVDSSLQNNRFAAISSLPPNQLNAAEDMIPVQSDLPPPVLPPLVPVDNQDSINPNFISNHVTPLSGDIVVATHSHDIWIQS